ncbi:MAG: Re/Si-specific NAD(P)(+) transhydrogenase subunit alpha [Bacteroidales bacterium]|nr:Re/Si-specific NAD(P)(+) transhydrogenase subunit alpha [Bacteroidales bacterium]
MKLGIVKEPDNEQRVVMLPSHIKKLTTSGNDLLIEKGAGDRAFAFDKDYEEAGAKTVSREELFKEADMILGIRLPGKKEIDSLKPNQILVFVIDPLTNTETVKSLKEKGNTVFSMDIIPRITRAQDKDILSSMATVSGYRAVLEAALHLPRFFPMFMTAAGTIRPAKVLVLGAGVAGLQAIATARRLGARVEAFDVRSEVKEQVESLGAKFVEVKGATEDKSAGGYAVEQSEEYKARQRELVQEHARSSHVVITTAQIPGRKAPVLITKETVENMMPGSVIIDLAASSGGNCEVTKNGETYSHGPVTIVGKSDYPSYMSIDASTMFGNNLLNFLKLLIDSEGKLTLDFDDEIIRESCVVHQKDIYNKKIKSIIENQ